VISVYVALIGRIIFCITFAIECGKNRPWSVLIDTLLFSGSMEENDESH